MPEFLESSTTPLARDPSDYVAASTSAKIRKFLYELAEGTKDYRSLQSLTEQVEHQYHGRFLIELIQNAHDALAPPPNDGSNPSRIEIAIRDEGSFGTLYVANDGMPFSRSNFDSLSQLGNSDKDPQSSIGNKGIGFRSVLEVATDPSVYSRSGKGSGSFDGFCFGFSPKVIERLQDPILRFLQGDDSATSPIDSGPLVDWDGRLIAKFRNNLANLAKSREQSEVECLKEELSCLSPYLLPFQQPEPSSSVAVCEFESRGFASVICLPFKSAAARQLAIRQMEAIGAESLLFLERTKSLTLDLGNTTTRVIFRHEKPKVDSLLGGSVVRISTNQADADRNYWLWRRELGISDAPEKVRSALGELPGKWPQLKEAVVSIAVCVDEAPRPTKFSVFLPTMLGTGTATHVNAPFFGDMSRTHIDFGDPSSPDASSGSIYNNHLLSEGADLAISIVESDLRSKGSSEARAIIDLISTIGTETETSNRWDKFIKEAAFHRSLEIQKAPWILTDMGWCSLEESSILPEMDGVMVLTPALLRKHATFAICDEGLDQRRQLLKRLAKTHSTEIIPTFSSLAETLENVAEEFLASDYTDWTGFWKDTEKLFGSNGACLLDRKIILGNDGILHASGSSCALFFVPKKGTSDDEELENEGDVKSIPHALQSYVAFLNEEIQTHEDRNGRSYETDVRKYLYNTKLVNRFNREDIFSKVLISRTPRLPVPLDSPDAPLCRDILLWGLRLLADLVERSQSDRLFQMLKSLPAPCIGGWYPLGESSFGPGWESEAGDLAHGYLKAVATLETKHAIDRMLLPAKHHSWDGSGMAHLTLLKKAGVTNGLRLTAFQPKAWSSRFDGPQDNFMLPTPPQSGWNSDSWESYRKAMATIANPYYKTGTYQMLVFYGIPGGDLYPQFSESVRLRFMEAVLASAATWPPGWHEVAIKRITGNSNEITLPSPLCWTLGHLSWIGTKPSDEMEWWRPNQRWHVPTQVASGRKSHFSHLNPLPGELALKLDRDPKLADFMEKLGMPRYDPEKGASSGRLLADLTRAAERNDVPNPDVFLGQVRDAWQSLPEKTTIPRKILVYDSGSRLVAVSPDPENPIYLPDSGKFLDVLRRFNLRIVAIESSDAKRLGSAFEKAFPGAVVLTSTISTVPLVDDQPWTEGQQQRLMDSQDYQWLVPVILVITAFYGQQGRGTETIRFRELVSTLREAKVCTVSNLKIVLKRRGNDIGAANSISALWVSEQKTLLLRTGARDNISGMAEALASLADRDLETQFALALQGLGSTPSKHDIFRGLALLRISEANYRQVEEYMRGDIRQIIDRILPLVLILHSGAGIGTLMDATDEDHVASELVRIGIADPDGREMIKMAAAADGMFEFGSQCYQKWGREFGLDRWNEALEESGQERIQNSEFESEFSQHLKAAIPPLRCFLVTLVARAPSQVALRSGSREIEESKCPADWAYNRWEVEFQDVMTVVCIYLVRFGATAEECEAIGLSESHDELVTRLKAQAVDVDTDPFQTESGNLAALKNAVERLQRIGFTWAQDHADPAKWLADSVSWFDQLWRDSENIACCKIWDESHLWTIMQKIPVATGHEPFQTALCHACSLEDLVVRLGISQSALEAAEAKMDETKERERRRNRSIKVCGVDFDTSEDNIPLLWSHICGILPSPTDFLEGRKLDLTKPCKLGAIDVRVGGKGGNGGKGKGGGQKHPTKAMENLIGLAGEIHAFRILQGIYGASVVSSSCWVSSYSALVGLNQLADTDNGKGCDFVIPVGRRIFHVEIKSSESDSDSFSLGSSEIRLAMQLAKKSRSKSRGVFLVMRVQNALSLSPTYQILPNPYDPKYQQQFVVEDADARVRYKALE